MDVTFFEKRHKGNCKYAKSPELKGSIAKKFYCSGYDREEIQRSDFGLSISYKSSRI